MSAHIVARDQLRSFIERIERLEAEKQTIADDIKDVYGEAKSTGFDTKILRKVISIRKQDADERAEQEAILDTYLQALGMKQFDMFDEPEVEPSAKLVATVATAMQTTAGRAALLTAVDTMIEREERIDPTTGEFLDDEPVTIIDQTDADGHHITVTVDPQIAAILSRSDSGLNIVTKHTEIAAASQGEAVVPSDEREPTGNEVGETSDGANAGGEDVDGGAVRADPKDQENIEPSGPEAERAPHTSLAREFGLNVTDEKVSERPAEAADGIIYESVPPMPMKSLSYASCFPELTAEAFRRLKADIETDGVHEPIVRMGDVIVDGWSRYNAARSLGIEYPVISYSGNDVLIDVIKWQRSDRDWTPAQERKIAAALAKEIPHRAADIRAAFSLEKEMA
jgi:uncharacterized protein (UPF0335 family)